jgi:hypothetical protein
MRRRYETASGAARPRLQLAAALALVPGPDHQPADRDPQLAP